MKKYMSILSLGLFVLVAACTSQEEYLASLRQYNGMSEAALVEKFGPPDRVYDVGGKRYISYISRSTYAEPDTTFYGGTYGGGVGLGTGIGMGNGGRYRVRECENTFVLANGVVERSGYKGSCY